MAPFVHLRVHSQYSVGFGTLFISAPKNEPDKPSLLGLCKKYDMPAALADGNLMSGASELSDKAPGMGVQPIIGITISLNHHQADPAILRQQSLSKVVLLAQSRDGWLNLCALSEIMYMRPDCWHLGPHVLPAELFERSGGLICLSGGHGGPIGMSILDSQDNFAGELCDRFREVFKDRFYMELSRFGLDEQIKTEPVFLRMALERNIPIVATNDVCFAGPGNYKASDALHCILGQERVLGERKNRAICEQYFKSPDEMRELFSDLPEAAENTVEIAKRCAFMVNVREKPLLPKFAANIEAENLLLRSGVMGGLAKRISETGITDEKRYYDQAEFELETIIKMGFPGYFLIVADYIKWAEEHDIAVGPGRGSGPGSVAAWALGISKVDPLKNGLLFERFLNPDRISMPDFDIDFEPDGIERIMEYIQDKYGRDHICRIITFGSLQARGAIRDVARVLGVPYSKGDRLAKMIPQDAKRMNAALSDPAVREFLDEEPDMRRIVDVACELEGAYRSLGQHACGVVIGDRPTREISPLYRDPSNQLPSSQFDGHYLEPSGLIKFDFLGLETLTIIKRAIKMIKKGHGIDIDPEQIPLEDEEVYKKIWQRGWTLGVFQFDAPHVQRYLQQMKPTKFANIVALNALNRPGPAAFIPNYIARMHGDEPVSYPHPLAEDILRETYGILVYQEQVMLLARALAGYTRGESDSLRKAMGKKLKDLMDQHHTKFVDGCLAQKTLDKNQAEELYAQFVKFAEYAFNKAHALVYSVIANECAWLKCNYPAEFIAAGMSSELGDADYMADYVRDARNNFGLDVLPPDVNRSQALFSVENGKIAFGLAALKGVGLAAMEQLAGERAANGRFKNLTDFAKRAAGIMNKRILESLIKSGALDSLCPDRARLYFGADAIVLYAQNARKNALIPSLFDNTSEDDDAGDRLLKDLRRVPSWGPGETMEKEIEALGFAMSASPLEFYKKLIESQKLLKCADLARQGDRRTVRMAISVVGYSRRTTKAGKPMIAISGTDGRTNIDAVAFGEAVPAVESVLRESQAVVVSGRTAVRDGGEVSLFVDSAQPIGEWAAMSAQKIILSAPDKSVLGGLKGITDALPGGIARITLKLSDGGKSAEIALPRGVRMTAPEAAKISALGIKVEME